MTTLTATDVLALTLWAEARSDDVEGRIAVACCVRERVHTDIGRDGKPDWWGEGYIGVCRAPKQFSCWNAGTDANHLALMALVERVMRGEVLADPIVRECYWIADGIIRDVVRPRVGLATHYHAQSMATYPGWTKGATLVAEVGSHLFYKDVK